MLNYGVRDGGIVDTGNIIRMKYRNAKQHVRELMTYLPKHPWRQFVVVILRYIIQQKCVVD
jgi:hypothetical protein